MPKVYEDSKIFILDDNENNLVFLSKLLRIAGYKSIVAEQDPSKAEYLVAAESPDLVITDLHMPGMSGFEVVERLRATQGTNYLPILVFTADTTLETRQRALRLGATDFLTKPGDACEITLRVRNFLEMRHLHRKLETYSADLELKVRERTRKLQDAQIEIVHRLALTGEYRDDDTGQHCRRVASMAHTIATEYGLDDEDSNLIFLAAPLHDIGKVGIPDAILHKPGLLTQGERSEIQVHTELGASILANSESEILKMAYSIALTHHERWDGSGYGRGLKGADIPISGRIVAVADVYDALINERPYKRAWTEDEAIAEIISCAGSHFDPEVVQAFNRAMARTRLLQAA